MEGLAEDSANGFIDKCVVLATDVLKMPANQLWIDYDREADVLYMSFRKPQRATETVELEEDMLLRKDGEKIVGLTILNASSREKV
ncbi:MAG: DUF2283 domain-containing protein [Desulfococcaceae bacterium]